MRILTIGQVSFYKGSGEHSREDTLTEEKTSGDQKSTGEAELVDSSAVGGPKINSTNQDLAQERGSVEDLVDAEGGQPDGAGTKKEDKPGEKDLDEARRQRSL